MKGVPMRTRFMVLAGTVLVALLALSGVAWAADPLVVTKTVPDGGATGVAPSANIDAYFNQDVADSTVKSRKFKIREKGTTTWLGATRSVNNTISPTSTNGGSESVVTLNPDADLAPNTIYKVVIVGGTSGVKGVNGEILSTNKKWTFTTATGVTVTPTTLDLSPTDVLGCARSANLTVTNNGPGDVTFADASITGTDAKYFSDGAKSYIVNNGPFTVLEGNHFFDEVTFSAGPTPTERNSDKVYRATLTYKDGTGATLGDPVNLTATTRCLNLG
jgi:Bacterial Ig-like domain